MIDKDERTPADAAQDAVLSLEQRVAWVE